jgi:hypothetical protein
LDRILAFEHLAQKRRGILKGRVNT